MELVVAVTVTGVVVVVDVVVTDVVEVVVINEVVVGVVAVVEAAVVVELPQDASSSETTTRKLRPNTIILLFILSPF